MTKETRYGVISEIHEDPRVISPLVQTLQLEGIDKIILNGDIGGRHGSLEESQGFTAHILDTLGKLKIDSFIQPGSHETLGAYLPVIHYFTEKYPNIVDVLDPATRKIKQRDHDLVFLPGTDFSCGGECIIGNGEEKTGMYNTDNGKIFLSNMHDLRKQVTDPEKTILMCHVPRKFGNIETGVDVAHFHQQRAYHRDFKNDVNKWTYTEISVMPGFTPREQIEDQGVKTFGLDDSEDYVLQETLKLMKKANQEKIVVSVERKENRGNTDLARIYNEIGITKAVSGHFHESVHRACDSNGDSVPEGTKTKDLFWNASYADAGKTGILTVGGTNVSYKNIKL